MIVLLVAVTCIGIVMSAKFVFAAMTVVLVQITVGPPAFEVLQFHPEPDTVPLWTTPEGRTSMTVVSPLVTVGPSFFTRST